MGKASREKGKRGERMLAKALREYGYDCRRTSQYCGQTGDASDVVGLPGIHIECKFVERLNIRDAVDQAARDAKEGLPAVMHKKSNEGWLVTMRLEDWMRVYGGEAAPDYPAKEETNNAQL